MRLRNLLVLLLAACGPATQHGTVNTPTLPEEETHEETPDATKPPPKPPEKDPWAGRTDLIQPPVPTMPKPLALPKPVHFTLADGLPVVVVPQRELPVVAFQLAVRAGTTDEPRDKRTLADIAAALLMRGTKTRSPDDIAAIMNGSAGSLGSSADFESTHVACSSLVREMSACLTILPDALANPTFPDDAVQEVKDGVEDELKRIREQPGALAGEHLEKVVWGGKHVRGWPATVENLRKITRDDVVAWHKTWFVPQNAMLVVAGDVDPDALHKELDKAFAVWKGGKKPPAHKTWATPKVEPQLRLVQRAEMDQAVILIGQIGIPHAAPDFFATAALYQAMGGRLSRALDAAGVQARASGSFERWATPGTFEIQAISRAADAGAVLRTVLAELERVRDGGISADELAAAQQQLVAAYPLGFQHSSDLAGAVLSAQLHGLGDTYAVDFPANVAKVTPADVAAAAKAHLDPDHTGVVILGRGSEVQGGLNDVIKQRKYAVEAVDYLEPISRADREALAKAKKAPPDPKKTAAGLKLLDQALAAKGGKDKLRALKDLTVTGDIRIAAGGQSLEGKMQRWLAVPDQLRLDTTVYNTTISMVIDKERVWERVGAQVQEFPSEMVPELRAGLWRDRDMVLLRHLEKGTIVQAAGGEKVGKRKYDAVVLKQADGGVETKLLLDPDTHQIFRLTYEEGGESAYEEYGDYHQVDGLWFAFQQHAEGGGQSFDVVVKDIKVNAGLPAGVFDKPR